LGGDGIRRHLNEQFCRGAGELLGIGIHAEFTGIRRLGLGGHLVPPNEDFYAAARRSGAVMVCQPRNSSPINSLAAFGPSLPAA
jgi:hypothetical protein